MRLGEKRNQKTYTVLNLVNSNMAVLARYDHLYNYDTNIVGIINHFLIGLTAWYKRRNYV